MQKAFWRRFLNKYEIIKKIEPNQSLTFEFNSGTYRMYLIGESAKVTVKYNIES